MKVLTANAAVSRYGAIINGSWANEASWLVLLQVPESIAPTWINTASGKPTEHIYCNKDMVPALNQALQLVEARGLISQLKSFDGCENIRRVRGDPNSCSTHSYGLAIDLNASTNQMTTDGDLSPELVQCFKEAGFDWGGEFHTRKDPMHFSYGWE